MATTAFGSITIVDITDVGEFSVYPQSNQPLSVIYSPDGQSFEPNWGTNNLRLTPVVYYAGKKVALTDSKLSISWQRQEGISEPDSTLKEGESFATEGTDKGILKVTSNQFTANSSMITYIVIANYIDSDLGINVEARGQITFSMVKQAGNVKICELSGENIFKYNTDKTIVSPAKITIVSRVENCSIDHWEYSTDDKPITSNEKIWNTIYLADESTKYTETSLEINPTNTTYFPTNGDRLAIRLKTDEATVYDTITIFKLYDGVAGTAITSMLLTNEDQMIAFTKNDSTNPNGTLVTGALDDAYTKVQIYTGDKLASGYSVQAMPTNVTGTWQSSTDGTTWTNTNAWAQDTSSKYYRYKVTGWANAANINGKVTFTATKTDSDTLVKTMSLTKVQPGTDGNDAIVYSVSPSVEVISKKPDKTYNPTTITFEGYSKEGVANRIPYSGRFKIYVNGSNTAAYTSSSNETSKTYTIPANTTSVKIEMYAAGGTSTLLDSQTISVVESGESSISATLGNYGEVINCTSKNKTIARDITIPFRVFQGTNMLAATIAVTEKPAWITVKTNTAATTTSAGLLILSVIGNIEETGTSGDIKLTLSYKGATGSIKEGSIIEYFGWSRNSAQETITISSTEIKYHLSTQGTTPPNENDSGEDGWSSNVLTTTATKNFLWTRTKVTYSDGTTTTSYGVTRQGSGVSISSKSVTYASHTNGTSAPATGWGADGVIPTVPEGQYLWTKTTVTYSDGQSTTSYSVSYRAKDGADAAVLTVTTPLGYIIENGENTVTAVATLMDGSTDVTSGQDFTWYKYNANSTNSDKYDEYTSYVTPGDKSSISIPPSQVDGYASFKCQITYDGKVLKQYVGIMDKTDPIQATIFSSLGTTIKNSVGKGALYCKVTRNGEELDPMPTEQFYTSLPIEGFEKDSLIYLINSNKTISLYRNNGNATTSSWVSTQHSFDSNITYKWTFRDKDGSPVSPYGLATSGKMIYIDNTMITQKITIDCEVTVS